MFCTAAATDQLTVSSVVIVSGESDWSFSLADEEGVCEHGGRPSDGRDGRSHRVEWRWGRWLQRAWQPLSIKSLKHYHRG